MNTLKGQVGYHMDYPIADTFDNSITFPICVYTRYRNDDPTSNRQQDSRYYIQKPSMRELQGFSRIAVTAPDCRQAAPSYLWSS